MTITTAKQRPVVAPALRLAPLALAALLAANPARAEWRVVPIAGVTETFTDNVNLGNENSAKGQFVSEGYGAIKVAGNGRRFKLVANAEEHLFVFARGGIPNTHDHQLEYRLAGQAVLVDDLLFFDGAASGGPQVVSAFGPQMNNNLYALGNRADVSTWRLSPYLHHTFGRVADATVRYTRDSVDAGARNPFASSTGTSVAADLASGRAWERLGWGVSYMKQDLDNRLAGPSSSEIALANVWLRLTRTFRLTGSRGYDKYDYQSLGGRTAGANWSAGFAWAPSSRTNVQASVGRRYFGKTASLAASHRHHHSVWSINYSDAVTTTRSQFLLPASIDTASMLDRLFATSFPDPVERAAAVAAYMQQAGLPATLADSINYLSNRYFRQKDFRLGAAFKGAHNDLVVGVFDTTRIALSAQQSDSELLGSSLLALNDSTRQRGVNAVFNRQLSARDTASLSATIGRTKSLSLGYTSTNTLLRAGVTRRFTNKMYGMVEVRHSSGGLGPNSSYSENAVSATLARQF